MSIFERTVKLVLAACLSIWIAQFFQLHYATSAGVIAILGVLDTRRSSLNVAVKRFLSVLLAFVIATIVYFVLGYSIFTLALYLLMYIPVAYKGKLETGIAPSTVLVLHLFLEKSIALPLIANELLLFVIGTSIALVFNLYMPSKIKQIEGYALQVEARLKEILLRFQQFLVEGNGRNEGILIKNLDVLLNEALDIVYLQWHNQLFQQTNYQVHYFEMRKEQNKILRQIAENMNHIHFDSEENYILSKLFERTANQLSRENSAKTLLDDIEIFLASFRMRSLPETREVFEARATLFQILHDLKRFIQLKVDFYETYSR